MDCVMGIVGDGFTLLAADSIAARSIMVFKNDEDKIYEIDQHKALAAAGDVGDRNHFCEYVIKNIHLYQLRTDISLSTHAVAKWTRNQMAQSLRKHPYQVNLLIGGWDKNAGPELYFMDYLGSMHKLPFGVHGHGSNFTLSIMDKEYKPGMSLDEAIGLLKKCIKELGVRFLINYQNWIVKVIDADGTRVINLGDDEPATVEE
mmetsp:Transcript_13124/g.14746  ORF Transcript_13124/g.14746 Transcript_13124/m.14746 type:complete len:203 (+) Transcript_13124:27-635(+)